MLRELAERLEYLRNLEKRREEIAKASLEEQGVMNDELQAQLAKAATLSELEDIYRPFRPKRRTRATIAKERGLEPLALWLLLQQAGDPAAEAAKYRESGKGSARCGNGAGRRPGYPGGNGQRQRGDPEGDPDAAEPGGRAPQ